MLKKFPIQELEELLKPYDLVDCLDSLLSNGKLVSYYYDYDNGEVELEISDSAVIEEMFNANKLNPNGGIN